MTETVTGADVVTNAQGVGVVLRRARRGGWLATAADPVRVGAFGETREAALAALDKELAIRARLAHERASQ